MKQLLTLLLAAAAAPLVLLTGCSAQRAPLVTVDPSYSYRQAEPQLADADIWPVRPSLRASRDGAAPVAMADRAVADDLLLQRHMLWAAEAPIDPLRVD